MSFGVPPSPKELGPGEVVLAFDVGGTDTKSAIVDATGRVLGLARTPTPLGGSRRAEVVVAHVADLAAELRAEHPHLVPTAAGLIVPGIVDARRGVGVYSSNLGWRDAPIRDDAQSALGIPTAFHHDVTAASWAEHRLGAARAFEDAVVMVIGTGIAGSLILDGRLRLGGGYAGEIGHSPVADGPECVCGSRGCLEAIASAGAIVRRYEARTGVRVDGARDVVIRAAGDDPDARNVWSSALDALALSMAQLTAVLAPQVIVVGGGLAQAGAALFDPLRARLDALLSFHRRPLVVPMELGDDAGLLGAALLARDHRRA